MGSRPKIKNKNISEASFSLIETVIAIGILAAFLMQYAAVQGNAIYFSEYGSTMTKGIWLANKIISQVENEVEVRSLKDVTAVNINQQAFENFKEEGFTYTLTIEDWKLPILNIMSGMKNEDGDEGSSESSDNQSEGMMEGLVKQIFGDEPMFKIAKVEVSWPEGLSTNSFSTSLLLANQKRASKAFITFGLSEKPDKPLPPPPPTPPPPP